MMEEKEQDYAKKTFDEVAENYNEIPFFKISAEHVSQMVQKRTKKRQVKVLDVACGTGNVVLQCAENMPESTFDAIDISEGMLAKAKQNAQERNISNVDFWLHDITKEKLQKQYHVITCSYALFFLPHAPRVLNSLLLLLRTKGIVIFTTFTAEAFNPSSEILLSLLKKYGSKTANEYDPDKWENLKTKKDIERLCTMSYVTDLEIETKEISYGMSIDEWWELHNNTGYKGMLMELNAEDNEKVKNEYYEAMFKHADMDGEVTLVADSYFVSVS